MKVTVVSGRKGMRAEVLELSEPATVGDVLAAASVQSELDEGRAAAVGIWGRVVDVLAPVRDGDRVELYLPLGQDPRRERQRRVLSGTTMGAARDRGPIR